MNSFMQNAKSQRFTLLAGAALLSFGVLAPSAMASQNGTGKAQKMKAVIELFTSQGCSSCPPADKLLESYIKRKDVIALTMPVDYWDYLGWKDTLASPHYSARQRSYARSRGDRNVYTPQIVINGTTHAIGSDRQAINRLIKVTNARLSSFAPWPRKTVPARRKR